MPWRFDSLTMKVLMLALAVFVLPLPWHAHAAQEEASEERQHEKLAAIARGRETADKRSLAALLRDRDPIIAAAAFDTLREHDSDAASEELLEVIHDTTEPTRLRALQLLVSGADADDASVLDALRFALDDPDSALVVFAAETLGSREDFSAMSALTDAMREGSVATRLLIVRSVGTSDAVRPYLYDGLRDRDETVRSAAAAALFPSDPSENEKEKQNGNQNEKHNENEIP